MSFSSHPSIYLYERLLTREMFFHRGVVKSSSGESLPAGASAASSHPYKIPQPPSAIVKYDSDFPLRKTGKDDRLLLMSLTEPPRPLFSL